MKRISGKKQITIICFLLCLCALSTTGLSQPGDPGTDPDVPISGIEWLLAAGGMLGARKIYNRIRK